MGFWSGLFGATPVLPVASPYQPAGDLVAVTVSSLMGSEEMPVPLTRDVALKVPALKRAHGVHCGLVAGVPFKLQNNGVDEAVQPAWLYRSDSGVSPYHRMLGVTSDLFMYGWALIGAAKGADGYPVDAMHVPQGLWSVDPETGAISIDAKIPARFHQIPIAIPLGMNGVLVDGDDTIRAARNLEAAHSDRIENPIPQTELHITDGTEMSRKAKLKLAQGYNEGRQLKGGATSVTPTNIEVKTHGLGGTSDLFESGRNAIRLDIANHAWVPASIIEGSKSGSGGDMSYSNDTTKRNELYDFGSSYFVRAIEARLSMDDVCPAGLSIRGDLSNVMTSPTPNQSPASED